MNYPFKLPWTIQKIIWLKVCLLWAWRSNWIAKCVKKNRPAQLRPKSHLEQPMRSFVSFWKCTGRGIKCLLQFCIPSFSARIRKLMASASPSEWVSFTRRRLPSRWMWKPKLSSAISPQGTSLAVAKLTTRRAEIESKKWAYWVVLAGAPAI